jgi:hypothetical protein
MVRTKTKAKQDDDSFAKKKKKVGKMDGRENVTKIDMRTRTITLPKLADPSSTAPTDHRKHTLEVVDCVFSLLILAGPHGQGRALQRGHAT